MKSKEFFDLAVKMRYVQKHYYLSTDKETRKAWRRSCKAYEKKMDDEIDRVTAIIREKATQFYVLEDVDETIKRVGEEWFYEHIIESLTSYFLEVQGRGIEDSTFENGFDYCHASPTFVINDMGDLSEDDMLEFNIIASSDGKVHLIYEQRLKG